VTTWLVETSSIATTITIGFKAITTPEMHRNRTSSLTIDLHVRTTNTQFFDKYGATKKEGRFYEKATDFGGSARSVAVYQ
jgi:hypothetical protein